MVTTALITVAFLTMLPLIFCALIRPESITFTANVLRLFSFHVKIKLLPEQTAIREPRATAKLSQRRKAKESPSRKRAAALTAGDQ